jgi:rhodanese-related sulfurtransferase
MNLALQTLHRANGDSLSPAFCKNLIAHGGQLVDIRSPEDFRRGTLPGALNLPLNALVYDYGQLNKQQPVILFGSTGAVQCSRAARLLAGRGFSRIYRLAAELRSEK